MAAADQSLVKVYSDRTYSFTTMVRHQGTVIAFAMDDRRRIVYTVLDLSSFDEKRGELDVEYWSENPAELPFPSEVVSVGYGVAGTTSMPVVKKGRRIEAGPEETLEPAETDVFLSSTARLSAGAPFQVLSDGTHVVVLRQAIGRDHADAVFVLNGGGSSGDRTRTDAVTVDGAPAALVDATLLCDRFLLVGGRLKAVNEVRYRRSRHKSRPGSEKDSLGAADMDGKAFVEPTQELGFIRNLSQGRFTAVLAPTLVQGQQRWQFFAWDAVAKRIDAFSVEQAADGLFNTQGSRYWTSPDPAYQASVYEREPGTCPFTGEPLVPVVPESVHGESALGVKSPHLARTQQVPESLELGGGAYTVEAWVCPEAAGGPVFSRGLIAGRAVLTLRIDAQGRVVWEQGGVSLTSDVSVTAGAYTHVAAAFDGAKGTLYVDGNPVGNGVLPRVTETGDFGSDLSVGGAQGSSSFEGVVDELRIWERERSQTEIAGDRVYRLLGNEPGLLAYYRFDEASGIEARDQAGGGVPFYLTSRSLWVTSEAPVGDHPGVRRDSFSLSGREPVAGLAATVYYQQEKTVSGYLEQAQPAKRQARVLLVCATRPAGSTSAEACLAAVDFAVGRDGRLADVPDTLTLTEIGRPVGETADKVSAQQTLVSQLESAVNTLVREVPALEAEEPQLAQRIGTYTPYDVTGFSVILSNQSSSYLAVSSVGDAQGNVRYRLEYVGQLAAGASKWALMRVPGGRTGSGYVEVAMVNLDQGRRVLEPVTASDPGSTLTLVQRPLDSSLPPQARWLLLQDHPNDPIRLLNVGAQRYFKDLRLAADGTVFSYSKAGEDPLDLYTTAEARLAEVRRLLPLRRAELVAKQAELAAAREKLGVMSGSLLGAADLLLPMGHLGVDASGLGAAGALLKFAGTDATPFLVDSAVGRVAAYYRGAGGQFFAAYLDTTVTRGVRQHIAGGLTLLFTARDAGVNLDSAVITVGDCTLDGTVIGSLCEVTITAGDESEVFSGVPRAAGAFAAVLNGVPDSPVAVGTVDTVLQGVVTLSAATPVALPVAGFVQIGEDCYRVTAGAAVGSATVTVTPAPPATAAGLAVSLVRYDSSLATASRPGALLTGGSRLVTVTADKPEAAVSNGTATTRTPGHGPRWRGDLPGRAFSFNGAAHYLGLPAGRLDDVTTPGGDLTLEAWVKPDTTATGVRQRVLHLNRQANKAALVLERSPLKGGIVFPGPMEIRNANPAGADFTIELWLKHTAGRTGLDTVISCAGNGLAVGFDGDGKFFFTFGTGTGAETLTTTTPCTDGKWHHWAVTFQVAAKTQVIYQDGVEAARRTAGSVPAVNATLIVGRADTSGQRMFDGQVAELRTWNTVRTEAEINALMYRRAQGTEAGLTGAWTYDHSRLSSTAADPQRLFTDASPSKNHGDIWGKPGTCDSPLAEYTVSCAVGDKVRVAGEKYPCGQWDHLAAVYEQSWGLKFNGSAWAETPDADQLDIVSDLTIEVFAQLDSVATRQGLISKGKLGDGSGGTVPYQLSVLAGGKLEFAFEETGPAVKRFTSSTAIGTGICRIAVVRRAGTTTQEVKGKRRYPVTNAEGTTTEQEFDVVERVDVEEWQDIQFVVNGSDYGTTRYTGAGPRGNDGPLEIGRAQDGTSRYPLKGVIGEVRIWAKAREKDQLGATIERRDDGLAARWTFEENQGNTTADTAGGFDLKLRGARWTADPDPRTSTLTLYRNGHPIPATTPATSPLTTWGTEQLTLGALNSNSSFSEFYAGTLEEVRLWRTARTGEQILDNLFTRLKGDKQDLLAYWPFDSDSTTATADNVADHSLRGNDLSLGTTATRPDITLSTAPLSTDTAAVRPALAGLRTPFHETISSAPAAAEYADLQYTRAGETQGVLKRAYTHISNGTWHLTTGYKVGDLISEWVSQVQFDPQLIGYIEGAPPVPSENLNRTSTTTEPAGSSSVTFKQADEITSTLSSSRERSTDLAFSVSASEEVDTDTLLITAPLGIGTAEPAVEISLEGWIGTSLEFSNGWTDETTVSQGTSTERDMSATLTGYWESDKKPPLNSLVGHRFVPNNNGFALVQSETADVFALRLAHTGTLVAYRMLPNPDIPRDWNIISFPINPQYTKQGTLDGAVGLTEQGARVPDPDYKNALGRGDHSYFKPREAYAIKRRILRERQQLESYYEGVSTDTHTPDPTQERANKVLEPILGSTPSAQKQPAPTQSAGSFANRNIANTYVWTADGGFFAESTSTVDVVTQTTAGSYSYSQAATASLAGGFEVFGVGVEFQMDGSIGGGISVTRQRTSDATRTNSLEVACNPTSDLQKYKTDGTPEYDAQGNPVLTPGKVDAYRFMTFYLGQDNTHFDDFYNKVVDPTWLANSTDADADALRQAKQSDHKPPCWRVLHRVTYISRILPPIPATSPASLPKALRTIDIQSNYELIRRLDPYIRTAATTKQALTDATRTTLTRILPQLLPHTDEITDFLTDFYGITE
ncbi:LamG-like jellyroll fold domain-containing protein [Streptomyces tsukubensis]|uniref:LamG domain-containing protein n=1 Tax=Streptomyces tsukubensis TaxID=83656 RepID=UPI003697261A